MGRRHFSNWAAAFALLGLALTGAPAAAEPVQRSQDGLILNGELMLAEGRTTADPVILLLHGTLAHHRMEVIATLQERLAERGLSSLAVSLSLGVSDRTGMYDCAAPHRHRHTDALGEIAGWIAWLKDKGAADIDLMGHSRGGNQIAWFAVEQGDPAIRRVVLLAPATADPEAIRADYRKRAGIAVEDLVARTQGQDDSAMIEVPAFLYCGATSAGAGAIRSYYADDPRFDTPTLIPRIPHPTLVIAGSDDTIVSDLPGRIAALGDEGPTEFVTIDGADHMFQDLYADDVADAVAAFLSGGRN